MANTLKKHDGGFTTIKNKVLKGTSLSPKAIGIWVQLLSLPQSWKFSKKGLQGIINAGERSINAGLDELNKEWLFYLRRRKPNKDNPKMHYEYNIFTEPSKDEILGIMVEEAIEFGIDVKEFLEVHFVGVENVGLQNVGLQNAGTYKESNNKLLNNKKLNDVKEIHKETEVDEIINYFSQICTSLPKLQKLTDSRRKAIKSRLKEYDKETILEVFNKVEDSNFLSGRNGQWQASFDWIMKPSNFVKILEDNYKNQPSQSNTKVYGKGKEQEYLDSIGEW